MNNLHELNEFFWEFILHLGAYLLILAGVFGLLYGFIVHGFAALFVGALAGIVFYLVFK